MLLLTRGTNQLGCLHVGEDRGRLNLSAYSLNAFSNLRGIAILDGKMAQMSARKLIARWLPAVVMMGIIFALSSLPSSRIPSYGPIDILIKKGGHALGYGLLGLSYYFALPKRLTKFYRAITALMMAILFALSDEYHQSFVQGRSSSLVDIFVDGVGATIAIVVGVSYSSNSRSNSNS